MDASTTTLISADVDAMRALRARFRSALAFSISIRALECLLIAASATGLTLAAEILSGRSELSLDARLAAGLSAIFAAAAWWLERKPDIDTVVRRIDRAQGWSGALVTVHEIGRGRATREHSTAIDRVLGERVAAKLSRADCLRAVLPRSPVLLALPFLSAAVLFFAIESRELGRDAAVSQEIAGESSRSAAIASVSSGARSLRSASTRAANAGSVATPFAREITQLADAGERVVRGLTSRELTAASADAELADQRARLQSLASDSRADRSIAADLAQAERALDAARQELLRAASVGLETKSDARSDRSALATSADKLGHRSGSTAAAVASTPSGSPANSATARTSSSSSNAKGNRSTSPVGELGARETSATSAIDRSPATPFDPTAGGSATPTEERGSNGGRWWPQRYDAVVQSWVDSLREDRGDPPQAR